MIESEFKSERIEFKSKSNTKYWFSNVNMSTIMITIAVMDGMIAHTHTLH